MGRRFLQVIDLPGSASEIELLIQSFSKHFSSRAPGSCEEECGMHVDTAFVLAFGLIMLSVDLHNPQIKNKMSEQQFVSPNHGIDGGRNLPGVLLRGYYQDIAAAPLPFSRK